jgi:peptidoglycan/LPS O-acetylase OafA/YrhL
VGLATAVPSLIEGTYSAQFIASSYLFIPDARPNGAMNPVVGQGWSLNYEMLFYLIFAIALFGSRRIAVVSSSLILVSLVISGSIFAPLSPRGTFWTSCILLEFILGMLVGVAYREGLRLPQWFSSVIIVISLLFFYLSINVFDLHRSVGFGIPAVIALTGATLGDFRLHGIGWRYIAIIGDASYALYLFHAIPVRGTLYLFERSGVDINSHRQGCLLVTVSISITAAVSIYYLIERPMTQGLRSVIQRVSWPRGSRPACQVEAGAETGSAIRGAMFTRSPAAIPD